MKKFLQVVVFFIPFAANAQIITTVAGNGIGHDGGPAITASVFDPSFLAFDLYGNLYFSENLSHVVRKIDTAGIITTVAGTASGHGFSGDGGLATAALLDQPNGIAVDSLGNLFIADAQNNRIRKITVATGIITTVAGSSSIPGFSGDGGQATDATLFAPACVCFDNSGNLLIGDGNRVRKVNASGIITTIAGNGLVGNAGDGGPATAAECYPFDMCIDNIGNLYIAEFGGYEVRKIDTAGIITTIAGDTVSYIYDGDGIPATNANMAPAFIAFNSSGEMYISDYNNDRIRLLDSSGIIHTVVGTGIGGFSGDGGPADSAEINYPSGLAFDRCGNLYFGQVNNPHIRKVTFPSTLTTSSSTISVTASPGDTVCAGTPVTFSATATGFGASPGYYWFVNGAIVSGATSSTYTYTPVAGDSVYCMLYTGIRCTTNPTINSNVLHMVINPLTLPSVAISAAPGDTVCASTSVTYLTTTTGGGSMPGYKWYVNGSLIAGASSASYTYTPSDGDSIRCVLTSSAACAMPTTVSSSAIYMVVNPTVTPTISIAGPTSDTVCSGTVVTYFSGITGAGFMPAYRWLVNGVVADSFSSYSYTPADGDSVRCMLISSAACAAPDTVFGNAIYMHVDTVVAPRVVMSFFSSGSGCPGDSAHFVAGPIYGRAHPLYAWYVNGALVTGAAGSSYAYVPANGDWVYCELHSSYLCASPLTATSDIIRLTVTPLPSAGTIAGADTVCLPLSGSTITVLIDTVSSGIWSSSNSAFSISGGSVSGIEMGADTVYYVVTNACGSDTASHLLTIIGCPDGVNTVIAPGGGIVLYPNPTQNELTITSSDKITTVAITNLLGQVISSYDYNTDKMQIDVSALAAGVYFVKVNGTEVRKFVKE